MLKLNTEKSVRQALNFFFPWNPSILPEKLADVSEKLNFFSPLKNVCTTTLMKFYSTSSPSPVTTYPIITVICFSSPTERLHTAHVSGNIKLLFFICCRSFSRNINNVMTLYTLVLGSASSPFRIELPHLRARVCVHTGCLPKVVPTRGNKWVADR